VAAHPDCRWRRIAADLAGEIETGRWQPDERLPTVVALHQQYGVTRHTIALAIAQLRQDGLLYTRSGSGIYVAARPSDQRQPQAVLPARHLHPELHDMQAR